MDLSTNLDSTFESNGFKIMRYERIRSRFTYWTKHMRMSVVNTRETKEALQRGNQNLEEEEAVISRAVGSTLLSTPVWLTLHKEYIHTYRINITFEKEAYSNRKWCQHKYKLWSESTNKMALLWELHEWYKFEVYDK